MAKKNAAAAATATEPVADVPAAEKKDASSPTEEKKHRRGSSNAENPVFKAEELAAQKTPIVIAKDVPRLNWKMNTSPGSLEDGINLDVPLTNPPLKAVQIWFPTGLHCTARNLRKGVTIKDALKAIHKMYHKKADDEIDLPVLDTIVWTEFFANDREYWGAVLVKQKKEVAPTGKKSKK